MSVLLKFFKILIEKYTVYSIFRYCLKLPTAVNSSNFWRNMSFDDFTSIAKMQHPVDYL